MKNYDNMSQPQDRDQVVEVTLQSWEYKWSFSLKAMGWNCLWLDILTSSMDFDEEYVFENLSKNNINLSTREIEWELWIKYYLKKEGATCEFEDQARDFVNNIVKLEIVDCKVLD